MCPQQKSENGSEPGLPPGAERFWGQFSEAKGGRSTKGDEPRTAPETENGDQSGSGHGHECLEWCPICRSAELLKATASPEIRQQIQAIQSEALTILRAIASTYAERTGDDPFARGDAQTNGDAPRSNPKTDEPKVTDISID